MQKRAGVHKWVRQLLAVAVLALLAACGGGGGSSAPTVPNTAPVANAGTAQMVAPGGVVTLDGSASTDANGDALTYAWSLTSKPTGSTASIASAVATAKQTTFTADVKGDYVATLVVNDGKVSSSASTVTITANTAPVANAGTSKGVNLNTLVTLDGSASADADGDALVFNWSLSVPTGSTATLSDAAAKKPTFTTDVDGDYVATLIVKDGKVDSAVSKVTITTRALVSTFTGALPGADGIGAAASFSAPSVMTRIGNTMYVGDGAIIRAVDIPTANVTTFLGKFGSFGIVDGVGEQVRFSNLTAMSNDGENLYVFDNYTVRKIEIATKKVTTLAGGTSSGYVDGTGSAAKFNIYAQGIVTDGKGNLYVADTYNYMIRKIVIATQEVTTLAGSTTSGNVDGTGTAAQFYNPKAITFDGTNLFVADYYNYAIRKVEIATAKVTTLVAKTSTPFYVDHMVQEGSTLYASDSWSNKIWRIETGSGVKTEMAGVLSVSGMTSDGSNLYLSDVSSRSIKRIVIGASTASPFAGIGASADGASGATSYFNQPTGILRVGADLYVADTGDHTIRKLTIATGATTTFAGKRGIYGAINATGTAASFNNPAAIASDGTNLYVADRNNHAIRQIVIATGAVTTLAGKVGSSGKVDGTGTVAQFYNPSAVVTDGNGNLYVADMGNHAIRKIVIATGAVTTVAGTLGTSGKVDAVGTAASFSSPNGVVLVAGALYVADTSNYSIRKIDLANSTVTTLNLQDEKGYPMTAYWLSNMCSDGTNLYFTTSATGNVYKVVISSGVTTLLAGGGSSGFMDGAGTSARFRSPSGIAWDGSSLYVADTRNNAIRKIQLSF